MMSSRVLRSSEQSEPQIRARWTNGLTKIFADLMVEEVQKGNRTSNNSFSKKAWKFMCDEFYQKTGLKWDTEQLKNRYCIMRKQHSILKSLLSRSDFRLDESSGIIIASNDSWNQYLKGHPDAEPIRMSGCPFYKQLGVIFCEPITNGKHDLSAEQEEVPSPIPCVNTIKEEELPAPTPGEESSSESDDREYMADNQERFQRATYQQTTSQPAKHMMHSAATAMDSMSAANRKRGRKGIDDGIARAILHMAAASRMRTAAITKVNERYGVADCIKELDAIQGLEEGMYFAALDLFDNRNAREFFLSLKGDKRTIWLRGKCSAAHPAP
ncbi:uncharacterized protein [Euphorbia lathyris]|uniref:uncharacterized protein n=1 Tax=Euphorbia lathyris TaxID=212925 RepID=UPI003313A4E3